MANRDAASSRIRAGAGTGLVDDWYSRFTGTPYERVESFQDFLDMFTDNPELNLGGTENINKWEDTIKGYAGMFKNMFSSQAGRDPTAEEYDNFFRTVIIPGGTEGRWDIARKTPELRQDIGSMLAFDYPGLVEERTKGESQDIVSRLMAPGGAFNVWEQDYMGGLTGTERALKDFQERLFEKLRPNLMTSLASQGLLNTGAVNEAFAGAAKDLGEEAQRQMMGLRAAASTDIANRRYDIATKPSDYALTTSFGRAPNLAGFGTQSLQNLYQGMLAQQNFQNQLQLAQANRPEQQSLLAVLAGQMLGGVASGAGQAYGAKMPTYLA